MRKTSTTYDRFIKNSVKILTEEEEIELFQNWRAAKESGDRRAEDRHLERIVFQFTPILKKMVRQLSGYNIDERELISEGVTELINAAQKFKLDMNYRFSTYVTSCMKGALYTCITKNYFMTNICTNATNKRLFFSMRRIIASEIKRTGNFEMTDELLEKISVELEASKEDVIKMNNILRSPYESLDVKINDDESSSTRGEMIPTTDDTPEVATISSDKSNKQSEIIAKAMGVLTPRERVIFQNQVLQHKSDMETLGELGERYSVSKERIRQIRNTAMEKVSANIREQMRGENIQIGDLL